MYSGSDSNESQKFPPWTLNPASYQNMSNDQVDWAALAQQWIIMKEAGPPPVPGETPSSYGKDSKKEDKGMPSSTDIQKEKTQSIVGTVWSTNETLPPPGPDAWNWNAQNQTWNWSNSWVSPNVPPPPSIGPLKAPLLPTPANNYGIPSETENDNAVHFSNSEYTTASGGYWTAPPAEATAATKHIKPHNKRYSKVNVPVRVSAPLPPVPVVETSMPTLDANKRKQLPAWIREGLEKMEKDKLKQLEKEKQVKQREEYLEKNKKNDKETMEILKSTMKERQKSKFESEGEESDSEPKIKSAAASPERIPLTPDELMIKVRRTMTEILLTVTNRQIELICKDELQRFLKRHKASDLRSAAPSGGANLSGKLGLGMYGEGSDSSSEDEDENSQSYLRDSDDDLKETIRRKKADFQRTEREIEERLEETEKRKKDSRSRSSSPESMDNDSQTDVRAEDQKHKQDDYPSPVNKSYEKSKNKSPTSYSDVSDYSNDRSQKSRRSSSSESNDSYKKSKSKYRSRSKSYSPDRRHRSTRWSRSKSPVRERDSASSRRDSGSSRKKSFRRSRSRSYSRSRRSRSSSYRRSRRSNSRDRSRRTRSRSSSRSRYSSSRADRRRRNRSRSNSSSRGKRSHRH